MANSLRKKGFINKLINFAKIPFFFNYSGFGLRGASFSGFCKSVLDLTEKYHGTVYGYVNLFGAIAGFIAPLLTGVITGSDPEDPAKWRIVRTFLECGISFWPFFSKKHSKLKLSYRFVQHRRCGICSRGALQGKCCRSPTAIT